MGKLIVVLLLLMITVGLVGSGTLAQAQGSGNPAPWAQNGSSVDYCLHWAAECGKPAADQYCRMSGYPDGAVHFQKAHMRPTWVLGDNKACSAPNDCIAFTSIQCGGSPGPRLANGYSVDWCLHLGTNCGKPAADRWCKVTGHPSGSSSFHSARMRPTWALGDNKACNGTNCVGFTSIQCEAGGQPID
jgi:hypothetical protein